MKVNFILARPRTKGYGICYKCAYDYVSFFVFQDIQVNEGTIYVSLDTVPAETHAYPQWDLKILLHQYHQVKYVIQKVSKE